MKVLTTPQRALLAELAAEGAQIRRWPRDFSYPGSWELITDTNTRNLRATLAEALIGNKLVDLLPGARNRDPRYWVISATGRELLAA